MNEQKFEHLHDPNMPRCLRGYFISFFSHSSLLNYALTSKTSLQNSQQELNIRAKEQLLNSWHSSQGVSRYEAIRTVNARYHRCLARLLTHGQWFLPFSFKELDDKTWQIAALLGDEDALIKCLGDTINTARDPHDFTVADLLVFAGHWTLLIKFINTGIFTVDYFTGDIDRLLKFAGSGGHNDFVSQLAPVLSLLTLNTDDHLYFCTYLLMGGHLEKFLAYATQYQLDTNQLVLQYPGLHIDTAAAGNWHVSDLLIEQYGFDCRFQTQRGNTLLHQAAYHGKTLKFKQLIEMHHLDKYQKDKTGKLPLHYAAMKGCTDIIALYTVDDWLLIDNMHYTAIHYLISTQNNAVLKKILPQLKQHTDITSLRSFCNNSLLMTCANAGNIDAFETLMPAFGNSEAVLSFRNECDYNIALQAMLHTQRQFTVYLINKFGLTCISCKSTPDSTETICHRLIKLARPQVTLSKFLHLIESLEETYPGKIKSLMDDNGLTIEQLCQDALRVSAIAENDDDRIEDLLEREAQLQANPIHFTN